MAAEQQAGSPSTGGYEGELVVQDKPHGRHAASLNPKAGKFYWQLTGRIVTDSATYKYVLVLCNSDCYNYTRMKPITYSDGICRHGSLMVLTSETHCGDHLILVNLSALIAENHSNQ